MCSKVWQTDAMEAIKGTIAQAFLYTATNQLSNHALQMIQSQFWTRIFIISVLTLTKRIECMQICLCSMRCITFHWGHWWRWDRLQQAHVTWQWHHCWLLLLYIVCRYRSQCIVICIAVVIIHRAIKGHLIHCKRRGWCEWWNLLLLLLRWWHWFKRWRPIVLLLLRLCIPIDRWWRRRSRVGGCDRCVCCRCQWFAPSICRLHSRCTWPTAISRLRLTRLLYRRRHNSRLTGHTPGRGSLICSDRLLLRNSRSALTHKSAKHVVIQTATGSSYTALHQTLKWDVVISADGCLIHQLWGRYRRGCIDASCLLFQRFHFSQVSCMCFLYSVCEITDGLHKLLKLLQIQQRTKTHSPQLWQDFSCNDLFVCQFAHFIIHGKRSQLHNTTLARQAQQTTLLKYIPSLLVPLSWCSSKEVPASLAQ